MSEARPDPAALMAQLTGPGCPFEIAEIEVRGIPWRVYANAPPSMRAVLERSRAFGDAEFLVYEREHQSFAQHYRSVAALARWLVDEADIGKGDRVAIALRNYPEWSVAFWATQAIGAVAVPLNAWWTGPELAYGLGDSGARLCFVDQERLVRLREVESDLSLERVVVVRHDGPIPPNALHWTDLCARFDLEDDSLPPADIAPEDDSTILYTSGTTGRSKGAVATHRNHITNITNSALGAASRMLAPPAPGPTPISSELPAQNCSLQTLPFFHIGGLSGLYLSIAFGVKLVLMHKWDTNRALELIERERVTALAAVPTVVRQVLESPELDRHDVSSLGAIGSGAAPVPPDLIARIDRHFASKVSPSNSYGLTETTGAVVTNWGAAYVGRPDSVGRPVPVVDMRVVDPESGADCATGEVGELWFRGPSVVRGYWNAPGDTAAAFVSGWFRSGDLGSIDADRFVYVVDRLKDMVLRGGENVYCAEVEATLFEHPAVADVAVLGLPHRSLGEEVACVVQRTRGSDPTVEELRGHVGARLAAFKVPSRVVIRDEPLPRNAIGKVLKRELRDELVRARGDR